MEGAVSRSRVTIYAMVSVSLVVWKIAPVSSRPLRSSAALDRLPLCAMAIRPFWWFTSIGWQLFRLVEPVVPYRVCATAIFPFGKAESSSPVNTSCTRPRSLWEQNSPSSFTTIPQLSCPLCCSAYRP